MRVSICCGVAASMLLFGGSAAGQSTFGSIVGTVRDASGAVLTAADLSVRDLDENTTRSGASNKDGLYELLNLKPGRYELTAKKAEFAVVKVAEIILEARQTIRADFKLELAPVEEAVVVVGTVPAINTENGIVADTKTFTQISQLPLNYRGAGTSPIPSALFVVPGVLQDLPNRPSIGGGLPHQVEYSVDGVSVVNVRSNGPNVDMYPSTEMLAEFKVTSVDNNAEFGQMGDVTVITKSGSNQVHGSALWFHQNAALDAKRYGSLQKQAKVFNTFGGSLGGPVYLPNLYNGRNKTFFFVDYEGNRQPASFLVQASVPTGAMRQGALDGVPGSKAVDPSNGAPFPGNVIPPSRINSVAAKLLGNYIPLPNYNAGSTVTDYRAQVPTFNNTHGYDARIDHIISPRQQIYARGSWKSIESNFPNWLLPTSTFSQRNRNLIVSHNYGLRPNLINEFRFGWSSWQFIETFPVLGADAVATLGLLGLDLSRVPHTGGFPFFDFSDGTAFDFLGHARDGLTNSKSLQFTNNLSWIKARHTMKFGFDIRRLGYEDVLHVLNDEFGVFRFVDGAFSGNAFADLLLGLPAQTLYAVVGPNLDERTTHYHFYAQDQWRVNDRLTLSLGLRWEVHPPMTEASGNITNFDRTNGNVIIPDRSLPPAPGFLSGINACPGTITAFPCTKITTASQAGLGQGLRATYYRNWSPRLGFAYRPFGGGRTVVRGGIGIFTQTVLGPLAYELTGVHSSDTRTLTNYQRPGQAPLFTLPQSYAGKFALDEPGTENFLDATDMHYKDPRSYQWNFTIERQFARNTSARVSYIGVQSVGMNLRANLNQQHAGTAPFSAAGRPYLAWNQILSMENISSANFQGLQVEASRRFRQGLFFQSSYALSKNIGNAGSTTGGLRLLPGEAFGQPITDRFNTRLDRGNLAGVRRHRFLFTGIYPLPFGKGRPFRKQWNRVYDTLLGGWDLSTITVLESGQFQTATIASRLDQSNTDAIGRGIFLRPDRIGDGNLPYPTTDHSYDITAFVPTPKGAGRFGNSGVGILRGPGVIAVAAGLAKNFQITEKLRMRMEGTFTNLPNHPNFFMPSVVVSTPSTFGKLTSVQSAENSGNRTGQVGIRLDF